LAKALLEVTGAVRINYEILGRLGNSKAALYAHVFPKPEQSFPKKLPTEDKTFSLTLSSLAHRGKLS